MTFENPKDGIVDVKKVIDDWESSTDKFINYKGDKVATATVIYHRRNMFFPVSKSATETFIEGLKEEFGGDKRSDEKGRLTQLP